MKHAFLALPLLAALVACGGNPPPDLEVQTFQAGGGGGDFSGGGGGGGGFGGGGGGEEGKPGEEMVPDAEAMAANATPTPEPHQRHWNFPEERGEELDGGENVDEGDKQAGERDPRMDLNLENPDPEMLRLAAAAVLTYGKSDAELDAALTSLSTDRASVARGMAAINGDIEQSLKWQYWFDVYQRRYLQGIDLTTLPE